MAAGVGKTYRMLHEGQVEAAAGRDVAVGYVESHDRADTMEQALGLEIMPRRGISYRGNRIEEMDLPGILERAPQLCLIDELAHTNAPGVEHEKRWEDVEQVLSAGIDVYSTVNVQHLESLNDQVTELTSIRVRETIPDAVIAGAAEVVLIDITPESLIQRLMAGKVYKSDAIQAALNNFYKIDNLAALRELTLRQVAQEVQARRGLEVDPGHQAGFRPRERRMLETAAPQAIRERLLALITPEPKAQRIVRRLAGVLGADFLIERDTDIRDAVRKVVIERGTTYVLMGTPTARHAASRLLRPSLEDLLVRTLPGIDVRIVADRALREEQV